MDRSPSPRHIRGSLSRRRQVADAGFCYMLLIRFGAFLFAQTGAAEPDSHSQLARPTTTDVDDGHSRGAWSTPVVQRAENNTDRIYTISAAVEQKKSTRQELTVSGERLTRRETDLSTLFQARNLTRDFELDDKVLLATVDGWLHACDRAAGNIIWQWNSEHAMIHTTNYPRNTSDDDTSFEEDYIFIVEPSKEGKGNIYIQDRSTKGELRKLEKTVQDLANTRPTMIPGTTYTWAAAQRTSWYTFDAVTGIILKQFDLSKRVVNKNLDQRCPPVDPFSGDSSECQPIPSFFIGRIEYDIMILDVKTGDSLCKIEFAEWTINDRDMELQEQHKTDPLGRRQTYSFANGGVVAIDTGTGFEVGPSFGAKFDSPVAQIFDIARPKNTRDTDTPLIILAQPFEEQHEAANLNLWGAPRDRSKVYVSKTPDGSYFLMSEAEFPFSTSRISSNIYPEITSEMEKGAGVLKDDDDMIGIHRLGQSSYHIPLLDAPPTYQDAQSLQSSPDGSLIPSKPAGTEGFTGNWASKIILESLLMIIVPMFALALYNQDQFGLGLRRFIQNRLGIRLEAFRVGRDLPRESIPEPTSATAEVSEQKPNTLAQKDTPDEVSVDESQNVSVSSIDTSDSVFETEFSHTRSSSQTSNTLTDPGDSGRTSPDHGTDQTQTVTGHALDEADQKLPNEVRTEKRRTRGGVKHKKKRVTVESDPADPQLESQGSNQDTNNQDLGTASPEILTQQSEMTATDALGGETDQRPERELKKGRFQPRKRGGVKHRKKNAKPVEDPVEETLQDSETEAAPTTSTLIQPVSLEGESAIPDPSFVPELLLESGETQVGVITVDTRMSTRLGDGSNGTIVFRGKFGPRDVAVKRLVRSPKNFAAAEIKHLPELDSHPNVVRFLCVQESAAFTWLALDLFTTSLDQIVEHPERHKDLVPTTGLDVNDILCQVTSGVEHLHANRVVHRDIKPQNVLVRRLKPNLQPTAGQPNLQVVLSDFGLCKMLDDGPGSAFALTGNHTAAGTTGWKAPELLASGLSSIITIDAGSSCASNPTSTSSELEGQPGQPLRRPGKSIDVFSMGCLFFYVMTQGGHPFDQGGPYARDLNIKENKPNTRDLLSFHNYTYEADDLILQMISHEPQDRPTAAQVLQHPYFWSTDKKLQFLCDVSDCYEREKIAPKAPSSIDPKSTAVSSEELDALEAKRDFVWAGDFLKKLPARIITEAGKQRKYTGTRMIDLLRLIRNKKNHFHDLPDEIKFDEMGGTLEGYYQFWSKRFPSLLVNMHCLIIERDLQDKAEYMELRKYFD